MKKYYFLLIFTLIFSNFGYSSNISNSRVSHLPSYPVLKNCLRPPIGEVQRLKRVIRQASVFPNDVQPGDIVEIGRRQFKIIKRMARPDEPTYKASDLVEKKTVLLKFQPKIERGKYPEEIVTAWEELQKSRARYEMDYFAKVPPHSHVVRGYSLLDDSGDILRVIYFKEGELLEDHLNSLANYSNDKKNFADMLEGFIGAVKGAEHVVKHRFFHHFLPRHILIEKDTNLYCIFDFDLPAEFYPLKTREEIEAAVIPLIGGSLQILMSKGAKFVELNEVLSNEIDRIIDRSVGKGNYPYMTISELRRDLENLLSSLKTHMINL